MSVYSYIAHFSAAAAVFAAAAAAAGAVPQGESRSVQIVLQAMTEEPPKTATDRFLVQATPVESTAPLPRSYWLELSRSEIEETRLSVSFKRTGSSEAAAAAAAAAGAGGGGAADTPGPGSGEDKGDADGAPAPAAAAPGSSSSSSGSSSSSSSSSSGAAGDLRQQYDQLVEYTLAMERHKEELVRENEALRQQLQQKSCSTFFSLSYLLVYLFVGFMLWLLLDRAFRGSAAAA